MSTTARLRYNAPPCRAARAANRPRDRDASAARSAPATRVGRGGQTSEARVRGCECWGRVVVGGTRARHTALSAREAGATRAHAPRATDDADMALSHTTRRARATHVVVGVAVEQHAAAEDDGRVVHEQQAAARVAVAQAAVVARAAVDERDVVELEQRAVLDLKMRVAPPPDSAGRLAAASPKARTERSPEKYSCCGQLMSFMTCTTSDSPGASALISARIRPQTAACSGPPVGADDVVGHAVNDGASVGLACPSRRRRRST